MKHGSHIMLQRLVRSTVSTLPRPYFTLDVPWLRRRERREIVATRDRAARSAGVNAGSIAITSSKRPCVCTLHHLELAVLFEIVRGSRRAFRR